MPYIFETDYNHRAIKAMAKTLRKTVRKRKTVTAHLFGTLIILLALFLTLPVLLGKSAFDMTALINLTAAAVILLTFLFENDINAYFAKKRMLAGTRHNKATFTDEGYTSENQVGKTAWKYDAVYLIAEDKNYFILLFDQRHAQVLDKQRLCGGSIDAFRDFLTAQTGKEILFIH